MTDINYCNNEDCPFEDCEWHWRQLEGVEGSALFSNYGGICRRYIGYLVDKLMNNEVKGE